MEHEGSAESRLREVSPHVGGFDVPVVLIAFNRPSHTKLVLSKLREVQVRHLFVVLDGPRVGSKTDAAANDEIRKLISDIDWDCQVRTNFAETNLGCRERPVSGLGWVFEHVEKAIVLEDDCVPNFEFFYFCRDLLIKYESDPRIGIISGSNLNFEDQSESPGSYNFSSYPLIWGWATWKRTWEMYDSNIAEWGTPSSSKKIREFAANRAVFRHWKYHFNLVKHSKFDAWDYQLTFMMITNKLLSIVPKVNLVSNVGFDELATHTIRASSVFSKVPAQSLRFPLVHPENVKVTEKLDDYLNQNVFSLSYLQYMALRAIRLLHLEGVVKKMLRLKVTPGDSSK